MSVKKTDPNFRSPITQLPGVGPKKALVYEKMGIEFISDLANHYPSSYEDLRAVTAISDLSGKDDGSKVLVRARVISKVLGRGFGKKRLLRICAEDASGRIDILFFNASFLSGSFHPGTEYAFYGTVRKEQGRFTMLHPSVYSGSDETGILPVYRASRGVSQRELRKNVKLALSLMAVDEAEDILPGDILREYKLCGRHFAYENLHFPQSEALYSQARFRLIFEEFFWLRLALLLSKDRFGSGRSGHSFSSDGGDRFISSLAYELTKAQKKVWGEVLADMKSETCMNRLVQGDVGSGKTAIAEAAMAQACSCGFQAVFMAPTEILAHQHFETLTEDLAPLGYEICLLSGSMPASEKKAALERIRCGKVGIVVGTHAVISSGVEYHKLGLVITDEQHRFGVGQRKSLADKGRNPDVMVMTATPIPRTLAVVLFGDLDVSVIDEMPPGRKPVKTAKYKEKDRKKAYGFLAEKVREGRQAYIVAPLISDSDELDVRSAEGIYEEFSAKYPDISAALLHGAMKQDEKDRIMTAFSEGRISVLISTVVIEVGINVPNATVMIIENSERFGLAQMHQLRGRVGRGSEQSYCLVILGSSTDIAEERADTICSTGDGFVIAEKDLQMRGPGEFFGMRQHGLPQLKLADPVKHLKASSMAAEAAARVYSQDPGLALPEHSGLLSVIRERFSESDRLTL